MERPIRLSPPLVTDDDKAAILSAIDSGWIAPAGPDLARFEDAASQLVNRRFGVALNSGTSAIHLGLRALGVSQGDLVLVPTETFAATAFAVTYQGAIPVFVDSDDFGNMDPGCAEDAIRELHRRGRQVRCAVVVDLYGIPADFDSLLPLLREHEIGIVEDAAEGLGGCHASGPMGSFGDVSVLSFNGNKIITTSGGGMLLTDDQKTAELVLKLATQAREDFPWYEHATIGHNYRLSNILAALGHSQIQRLQTLVGKRRQVREWYRHFLADTPGAVIVGDPPWGRSNAWLSILHLDHEFADSLVSHIREDLKALGIESRPVWKPMHQQPVFDSSMRFLNGSADRNFRRGLCLPSGTTLERDDVQFICSAIQDVIRREFK